MKVRGKENQRSRGATYSTAHNMTNIQNERDGYEGGGILHVRIVTRRHLRHALVLLHWETGGVVWGVAVEEAARVETWGFSRGTRYL